MSAFSKFFKILFIASLTSSISNEIIQVKNSLGGKKKHFRNLQVFLFIIVHVVQGTKRDKSMAAICEEIVCTWDWFATEEGRHGLQKKMHFEEVLFPSPFTRELVG